MKLAHQIALVLLASAATLPAFAAETTASASVKVLRPIAVSKNTDLAFGTVIKPASGTDTVAVANTSSDAASFTISGEGAQAITVTVDSSFEMVNGSDKFTVTTSADKTGAQALSGTLGSAGALAVKVGGSFALPAEAATGNYSGSFKIAAVYQ